MPVGVAAWLGPAAAVAAAAAAAHLPQHARDDSVRAARRVRQQWQQGLGQPEVGRHAGVHRRRQRLWCRLCQGALRSHAYRAGCAVSGGVWGLWWWWSRRGGVVVVWQQGGELGEQLSCNLTHRMLWWQAGPPLQPTRFLPASTLAHRLQSTPHGPPCRRPAAPQTAPAPRRPPRCRGRPAARAGAPLPPPAGRPARPAPWLGLQASGRVRRRWRLPPGSPAPCPTPQCLQRHRKEEQAEAAVDAP